MDKSVFDEVMMSACKLKFMPKSINAEQFVSTMVAFEKYVEALERDGEEDGEYDEEYGEDSDDNGYDDEDDEDSDNYSEE